MSTSAAVLRHPGTAPGGRLAFPIERALTGGPWRVAVTVAAILTVSVTAFAFDGALTHPPQNPAYWTRAALTPVLLIWFLIRMPSMSRWSQRAITALDSLRPRNAPPLPIFQQAVLPRTVAAIVLGAACSLAAVRPWTVNDPTIRNSVAGGWMVTVNLALFFTILIAILQSHHRVSTLLKRELSGELSVDAFDMAAFQPITNWALSITVTFLGVLTLIFLLYPHAAYTFPGVLILPVVTLGPAGLFAHILWGAHATMAAAKRRELDLAHRHWRESYEALKRDPASPELARSVATWLACVERARAVNEWPYTLHTLRTVAVSVIVPVLAGVLPLLKG